MTSILEKGGGTFQGIKMLLCENPLSPLDEAIEAATAEIPNSNYYTEAYSAPLRALIAAKLGVPEQFIHINAGSELILRQLFSQYGQRAHLLTPTYTLFTEIAKSYTETELLAEDDFGYDLGQLAVPPGTTLVVIVNPNDPTGRSFDMTPLPSLMKRHPDTFFLIDEAFIEFGGESAVSLVPRFPNVGVTRTFSKGHSLAGFRVGYSVMPASIAAYLNSHNDAYPLARASQAAAIATLKHEDKIAERVLMLREWAAKLAAELSTLGVRVFPSESYFFLADFSPRDATQIARELKARDILIKPLADTRLGPGFMRVTTATLAENERFIAALTEIL